MEWERLTVQDASLLLGISEGALRKRMARGSVRHEKDADGNVWVLLDPGTRGRTRARDGRDAEGARGQDAGQDNPGLVEELRDRISYLERQVEEEREARRRADTLMARLMDRVPELEARREEETPSTRGEATGETQRAPDGQDAGKDATARQEPSEEPERRSWWRRFFGFE